MEVLAAFENTQRLFLFHHFYTSAEEIISMVLDILNWTYKKYKPFCFLSYLLLAVSLIGYLGLIWHWTQRMIKFKQNEKWQQNDFKLQKKEPPFVKPISYNEKIEATPKQVLKQKNESIEKFSDGNGPNTSQRNNQRLRKGKLAKKSQYRQPLPLRRNIRKRNIRISRRAPPLPDAVNKRGGAPKRYTKNREWYDDIKDKSDNENKNILEKPEVASV